MNKERLLHSLRKIKGLYTNEQKQNGELPMIFLVVFDYARGVDKALMMLMRVTLCSINVRNKSGSFMESDN